MIIGCRHYDKHTKEDGTRRYEDIDEVEQDMENAENLFKSIGATKITKLLDPNTSQLNIFIFELGMMLDQSQTPFTLLVYFAGHGA